MKEFTYEDAMDAADTYRKRAISELEDLISLLTTSLVGMKSETRFDLYGVPELRMKQVREEVEHLKMMAKLADHLCD